MKILSFIKPILLFGSKHKSAIMSGCAIVTGIAGTFFGVKATIKAVKDVEKATAEKEDAAKKEDEKDNNEENVPEKEVKLTKWEVVKLVWKHFIPVFVTTAVTITLIVCAHHVDAKRVAAAASALALSEKMNRELQNKTIEEFGKEKAAEIQQAVLKKNPDLAKAYESGFVRKNAQSGKQENHMTTNLSYDRRCWFRDEISGREFFSTKSEVEYAVNMAMRDAITGCSPILSLNAWYEWLDIEPSIMGDMLGWDLNRGQELLISYEADIRSNGDPCLIMHYSDKPRII